MTFEVIVIRMWNFIEGGDYVRRSVMEGGNVRGGSSNDNDAVSTVTTTRTAFESVILGQRTLVDAMEHREITTVRDAKAVSDLFALLVDFEAGFPVAEPGR
jgi:alkyl sulfatase BDS1-like metallo-beta-lactamase superfamily hydrolase